jgi:hypothetical protein
VKGQRWKDRSGEVEKMRKWEDREVGFPYTKISKGIG